jgi:hypothetical protein
LKKKMEELKAKFLCLIFRLFFLQNFNDAINKKWIYKD